MRFSQLSNATIEAVWQNGLNVRRCLQTYTPAKAGGFSCNKKSSAIAGFFVEYF
jgi:hypothetical protein